MKGLEKLSEQEFNKLWGLYQETKPDQTSEFYISIQRNVTAIKTMDVENSIKEPLYAQVIETIGRNKDLSKMGNGLEKFFEAIGNMYKSIFTTVEQVKKCTDQINSDAHKIKWYQGETDEKLKQAQKGLKELTEQNDYIAKQNKETNKRLDEIKKTTRRKRQNSLQLITL